MLNSLDNGPNPWTPGQRFKFLDNPGKSWLVGRYTCHYGYNKNAKLKIYSGGLNNVSNWQNIRCSVQPVLFCHYPFERSSQRKPLYLMVNWLQLWYTLPILMELRTNFWWNLLDKSKPSSLIQWVHFSRAPLVHGGTVPSTELKLYCIILYCSVLYCNALHYITYY